MDTLFFVASKLVWVLIRPETLLVVLLGLGLIALWRRHDRLARRCLGVAFTCLVLLSIFPLGDLALAPLESRYPGNPELKYVAGIIVFGGGEEPERSAALGKPLLNEAGERFLAAIALAHRFPKAKVLFTGGSPRVLGTGSHGGSVAETIFVGAGLSRERLLLEIRSRNTAENAVFSRELAKDEQSGSWILVTSAWHLPRAIATFCRAGWKNLVPWPTDHRSGAFGERIGWGLARNLEELNTGVKEWVGLLAYWLTGRVTARLPEGCLK